MSRCFPAFTVFVVKSSADGREITERHFHIPVLKLLPGTCVHVLPPPSLGHQEPVHISIFLSAEKCAAGLGPTGAPFLPGKTKIE